MKKTLLLQTALVAAAGMMLADVANAQTKAQPLAITLGGFWTQFVKFQDKDIPAGQPNQHSVGTASDAEVYFNIRGVLDDGTVIGGQIQLEAATYGDQIDERYMFIERADVGRIEIGSTDRVHGKMLYFAPTVLPGHGTTVHSEYSSANVTPLMWFANNNHDAEGINIYTASNRYFGSKVGKGLQLGFSYTPDGCEDFAGGTAGGGGVKNTNCGAGFGSTSNSTATGNQLSKQYAIAANYLETLGPVDVALYGAWNTVHIEGALPAGVTDPRQDGWQVGAQFAYNIGDGSAIQFGGGYSNEDVGTNVTSSGGVVKDREAYSVGVRYLTNGAAPGSVGIGVEYYNREDKLVAGGKAELDYYQLGVTYQLATGVLTFAGVGVSDQEAPAAANDTKQTFGVVGIGLTF